MFWKYNNTSSSEIETLLQRQDVTLQEVMDCEDIINECRIQKKALIDFLLKPENLEELVNLTTQEPSMELDENVRFKYPNIACELLTSDVPAINERLASEEHLLDKLYSFLENEPPLNPLLASFFSKIMGALIAKKTEQNWLSYQFTCLQVLDFLKAKESFIPLLLKHLGTSAIMDLMLKLMTQVENVEMRQNILNWLDSQMLMESLVELLNPKIDLERHYNVAQLLCDFIANSRDTLRNSNERIDPDPLLNTLESGVTVSSLLDHIFSDEGKSESAIVGGIKVLLSLLDVNQSSSIPKVNSNINDEAIDMEHKQKVLETITESIRKHLNKFHNVLLNPPKKMPIKTTAANLDPPLGLTRLQVVKLFTAIISSNEDIQNSILKDIVELETFPLILDLFFQYPWNNFLHTQVQNCLFAALKTHQQQPDKSNALISHLIIKCKLVERILTAWKENDELEKCNGIRQGYMGHLINILNELIKSINNTSLGDYLKSTVPDVITNLEIFEESTLNEINLVQNSLLGGVYPHTASDNTDEYIAEVQFQEFATPNPLSNLPPHLIDGYGGFNDDAFNDGDDIMQTDMNFDIFDDNLNAQNHELFKEMCSQSINILSEETMSHEQPATAYSSDSDEDFLSSPTEVPAGVKEHENNDPWNSLKETLPLSHVDPWGGTSANEVVVVNNDFDSVKFDVSFENTFAEQQEQQQQQQQQQQQEEEEQEKEEVKNDLVRESEAGGDYCKESDKESKDSCNKNEPSNSSLLEGDNNTILTTSSEENVKNLVKNDPPLQHINE